MIFLNHDDSKALSILFVEKAKNTVNVESQSEICKRINEFMNEKVITDFSDLILLSFPKMASIVDRIEQDQIGYENECFEEGKLNNFYQMYIECYDHLIKRMNKKRSFQFILWIRLGFQYAHIATENILIQGVEILRELKWIIISQKRLPLVFIEFKQLSPLLWKL